VNSQPLPYGRLTPRHVVAVLVALAACIAMTISAGTAFAQTPAERASQLVDEGMALFGEGNFEDAAILFQEAYNLDPHPVLMFNIARAHQEMGDLPSALEFFNVVLSLTDDPNVQESALSRIEDIEDALISQGYDPATVTTGQYVQRGDVRITSLPEGAEVTFDGTRVGTTPVDIEHVDRGEYDIRLTYEGYHPIQARIEVRAGRLNLRNFTLQERTSLDTYAPPSPGYLTVIAPEPGFEVRIDGDPFGLTPIESAGLSPGTYVLTVRGDLYTTYTTQVEVISGEEARIYARMERSGRAGSEGTGMQTGGIVLMGVGGAAIGTGIVFGVLALGTAADYRDNPANPDRRQLRDRARSNALLADICVGGGIALAATGVVLYVVSRNRRDQSDPLFMRDQLVIAPYFGPEGNGAFLRARF